MAVKVEIDFTPTYELVTSLAIYTEKKFIKTLDLGNEWIHQVKKKLDPAFAEELTKTKEIPCLEQLNLLVWLSPQKDSIEGFIDWLQNLSPGDLYETLSPFVSENLTNDLGALRDQYVYLLTNWNRDYFQHVDPAFFRVMEEDAQTKRKLIGKLDPIELVEIASGGIRIEKLAEEEYVVMVPSVHYAPLNTYCEHNQLFMIHYSVDLPTEHEDDPPKSLSRVTKALADDNRLRILRFIQKKPRSFTDIMKYSKLSKSTVHHHLMVLRASGLLSVYVNTIAPNAGLYTFRPSAIKELNNQLLAFIEQ